MGGTYSTVAGSNPKLALYNSGSALFGFGVSGGQIDYIAPQFISHNFYVNSQRIANISESAITLYKPLFLNQWTTAGRPSGTFGQLGYNTTVEGIEWFNSLGWASPARAATTGGVFTATYIPFGSALGLTENVNFRFTTTRPTLLIGASGATGSTTPALIDMGGTFSSAAGANAKLMLYNSGGVSYGFGVSAGQMDYMTPSAGSHVFYVNAVSKFKIAADGTITQPNTTTGLFAASGTTAQTPTETGGLIRFNSDSTLYQIYSGGIRSFIASRAYVRSLVSNSTWLKPQLEAMNVKINSTNSLTFKNGITRWTASGEQTGVVIAPSFVGVYKTTTGDAGGYIGLVDTTGRDNSFYFTQDDRGLIQNTGIGRQIVLLADNTSLPGQYRWAFGARVDTSTSGLTTLRVMLGDRYASTTVPVMVSVNAGIQASENIANAGVTVAVNGSNGKKAFTVNDGITLRMSGKVYFAIDSTLQFDPSTDLLRLSQYGTNAKTAAATGKTGTNINATFATDGTLLEIERKRDTTIYIDDADYDWSAAITTAQIASRFNRVIFWMTTTAAAGSDSELTLHTPDVNLMQVEYLIHSVDEPAGFDNKIVFGTNNAVDSTNGLVTNYFPAAGDGIHIRAGLRSGVYKYRYSN